MTFETYKEASQLLNDAGLCREVINFVDKYMPPNGSGYDFKIVLHDKEFTCPAWVYEALKNICKKKKEELKKQFESL